MNDSTPVIIGVGEASEQIDSVEADPLGARIEAKPDENGRSILRAIELA